ncbi:retrotransposon Ty1-copia subclass [Lentinula edodes]|uniref:Retrotransposon Ty1-copia subclass n=2 Tax=Lentinula edodes TaxID=5353 RepID=A0A1Q3DWP9_LENED|nr:retrotransposon Ty1-copia subclass [Lentinula edodes]
MSSSTNMPNVQRFPTGIALEGEDNWWPYKREVSLAVESKGLQGYLHGTIAKPSDAKPAVTVTSPEGTTTTPTVTTPPYSQTPSPEEWYARDRYVVSTIVSNIIDPTGLGVDYTEAASEIWQELVKQFEQKSEELLLFHDSNLRAHRYAYPEETMEEHKRTMRNLLRRATNAGAVITDGQFRVIVLASLPKDWDADIRHLPGRTSSEAFIHLQGIWLQREKRRGEEEREEKKVKALLAMHVASVQAPDKNRPTCTNPNCRKVGHTIQKCWAKGGGAEGKGPNGWRFNKNNEPNRNQNPGNAVAATASTSTSTETPLETYVLSAEVTRDSASTSSSCTPCQGTHPADRPPDSNDHTFLRGWEHQGADEAIGSEDVHKHYLVPSPLVCTARRSNALLYAPTKTTYARTFIDSGATEHCWVNRSDFVEYSSVQGQSGTSALAGDAGKFKIHGMGTVEFITRVGEVIRRIRLTNVKHTPEFGHNLISLSSLDQRAFKGEWGDGALSVKTPEGLVVMMGRGKTKMYEVEILHQTLANSARSHEKPADIHTWHRRLGHVAVPRILRMESQGLVDGLQIKSKKLAGMCIDCIYGKATRRPFDEKLTHETEVLERVHIDLWGPATTQSIGGARYMMLFTDGASSVRVPAFLKDKQKETSVKEFHKYRIMAETQTGKRLRIIRVDGGGEFDNGLMEAYCTDRGITIEKITPYSSSANGMAERGNRTVIEGVRTFLEESGLPRSFWAEAAATFTYVDSFVPTARFPDRVPIEYWSNKRQDISHLRPFGCRAWATLPASRTDGKLARQAVECQLTGYMGRRGYRLWHQPSRTFMESRDVRFEEGEAHRSRDCMPELDDGELGSNQPAGSLEPEVPTSGPTNQRHVDPEGEELRIPGPVSDSSPPPLTADSPPPPQLRRKRENDAQANREDWATDSPPAGQTLALIAANPWTFASATTDTWVPSTFKQAMKAPEIWLPPMEAEYRTLIAKGCWELVRLPPDANLTGGRWTYAIKWGPGGEVLKRKARWVAQGYTQIQGQDYDKTYGAVARMESVRIVLAIIATLRLSLFQVDFTAAFLNSPISHDVYMRQPDGFIQPGNEDKVCKLKKSIYGTMQGSHDWQETLAAGYSDDGYVTSRANPCIRYRREGGEYTLTSTYGDDVCGGSSTENGRLRAVNDLAKRWESSEVSSHVLLGMNIQQNPITRAITISQKAYILRMLEHFQLLHVRRRHTPLPPNVKLCEAPTPLPDDDLQFMANKPYREFVGSVLWCQTCTRADIAFAAGLLARYQLHPGRPHWECVEWLAGYLLWSCEYAITYEAPGAGEEDVPGMGLKPKGYSDSDHAGCVDTRRSTSGYVFFMAGSPVSWSSKRQPSAALSSTEAEYIALSRACQQAVWLQSFLTEIDLDQQGPVTLLGDNFGSISLTENSKRHALVKHIDLRDHYIREKVATGAVRVSEIRTGMNVADVFTKALSGTIHAKMVGLLRLYRAEQGGC